VITSNRSRKVEDTSQLRHDLTAVLQAALEAVEPKSCARHALRRAGSWLRVGEESYDLVDFRRLVLVSLGKAAAAMALAAEQMLGGIPISGVVVAPPGCKARVPCLRLITAGHPTPDEGSLAAGHCIADLVSSADEADLVLMLLSGGASSLAVLPWDPLTLQDVRSTYGMLLRCGANIRETNTVRKHMCRIKGGHLARLAWPARTITLVLSDVPGDDLSVVGSGPTYPDPKHSETQRPS
jgi:glycerate-2-kinase